MMEENVNDLTTTRTKLKTKVTDLEQELKKYFHCLLFLSQSRFRFSHFNQAEQLQDD